jgi:glycine/D-amino acid oxidase-like deaminating enzyme
MLLQLHSRFYLALQTRNAPPQTRRLQRGNLQTTTPVTQISDSPSADGFYSITTSRGSLKARKIVFATNAYTAGIAPQFTNKIVPVRGICSRITAPTTSTPVLTNTISIRYGTGLYDYLIPRADGSIVVGGAKQTFWFQDPKQWYGVTDDSKLIEPAKHYFDGLMQRHFRGWENSGAVTDKVWTGGKWLLPSSALRSLLQDLTR